MNSSNIGYQTGEVVLMIMVVTSALSTSFPLIALIHGLGLVLQSELCDRMNGNRMTETCLSGRTFIGGLSACGLFTGCRLLEGGTVASGRPNLRVGVLSDVH